jgi:hypothetical protein
LAIANIAHHLHWAGQNVGSFRELCDYLIESSDLLAKNTNILDNVLETLDIQQHSLGVLFVLVAKFSEFLVSNRLFVPVKLWLINSILGHC